MTEEFPRAAVPAWLDGITVAADHAQPFPFKRMLKNSLYYPSSGFDGDPVKYLAGHIHSFIYVDYGYSESDFLGALSNSGFRGYRPIVVRAVSEKELTPNGWTPLPLSQLDGDPAQHRHGWVKPPFCRWVVFERDSGFSPGHGPARFSLLYLCADGAAAYQALYVSNSAVPKAIAVIQPGHSFGGNWTNFGEPSQILARTVAANPAGKPELLLYGGNGSRDYYRKPCWPEYGEHVCFLEKQGHGTIGVWRLKPE